MVKHISKIAHGSDVYYMKDTEARSALIDKTEKGVANGVATLDSEGKVPSSQLPSYVDDVEEYSSLSNFPVTGESGKIYIDTTTNLSYRWSGSTYVTISSDLALGETSSTAYAGDKGKAVTDNFNTHAANTDIHVTAAEKEYWNNKVNAPSYSAPTAKTLTYTGSAQDLLNAGSSTAGTIQYSTDETNWSTTIPQGTNANTYTVYWRFIGSEVTYVDSTEIEVTIAKANPTYTAPAAKSGLVYDGSAQKLIDGGASEHGTFKYSLDGINWAEDINLYNGHDYVDLGLSSGTKWATMNVGASSETDYGDYYQYGKGSDIYDTTHEQSNYYGNEDPLSFSVDTASLVMGGQWHMPTLTQFTELKQNTKYLYTVINNVHGIKYTSKRDDSKYIFLPASGFYNQYGSKTGVDSNCCYWTSSPSTAGYSYLMCSVNGNNLLYNSETRKLGLSVRGVVDGGAVNSIDLTQTNSGTYTVYWKFEGDANHNDISSTSITCSIAKVTPTVTAPTAKVLIYNTLAQVLANNGSTNFGTLQYSSDNTTWSSNIPSETNAGDYSVYYKVVGDSNINDVASTAVSCAISKVTPTVTAPTAKSLTYNTQSQVLANAGSTDYGTIKYSLDGVDYSATIPSATNVGFYTLYYKVDGDSNVNDVSAQSVSCLIDAKTVSSPTITLATNSYTYDGSAKQPSVTSVEDGEVLIPSSEYTVEYSNNTNAGTGTVTIVDANGGNYTVSGNTTFTINKAAGSVTTAPIATNDTYNGSAKVLATAGSGTGTMYYSLDNVDFSTTIPTSTDAGNWTLYYYAAESSNYTQSSTGSIAVSLSKANLSAFVSMAGWTYGGTASNPSVSGNSGSGNITYSYKVSGADDSTYTSTKPSNAGTYVVRAVIDATTNYNGTTVTNTFTIAKANRTVTISGNQTSMTPNQSNTITVTATGNPASSLISVASSNTAVATISGTTVNAAGAGTTTITVTVASDTNYNSGSASYSLNVAWPNGVYAYYADGSMRTAANADTNAIGVAVITNNCKFIIDKTNDIGKCWDTKYSTNGVIAGCYATNDKNLAKIDYNGVSNTDAIVAIESGCEAAKYCRSCSKIIAGKTVYGYLGACGEWYTAYNNKTTINSIMSTIGGTAMNTGVSYWTSTLGTSLRAAWPVYWSSGVSNLDDRVGERRNRPLYKIS